MMANPSGHAHALYIQTDTRDEWGGKKKKKTIGAAAYTKSWVKSRPYRLVALLTDWE